ncbi:MAG: precorrin-4 C(11)-methyltransferase, partial [Rhodospirillales bacterium]
CPAAVVESASQAGQIARRGTLADIGLQARLMPGEGPRILLVGSALAIDWSTAAAVTDVTALEA